MNVRIAAVILVGLTACRCGWGQDSRDLLATLAQNEQEAGLHRGHYLYMSEERSDRTGGRLWTEKVVETAAGRVRFLTAEDGQPVSPQREASERGRLAQDVANPDAFAKREAAQANDEAHAKQMLGLLPKAYLFDPPIAEEGQLRIHFRPNPDFKPGSTEERVLHAMTGSVVIDKKMMRLREVDGRLDSDVGLGFGPLAVVKAGSNFMTLREHVEGPDWKTEAVHTDITGRAFMLKTLARKQEAKRWGYQKVKDGMSVAEGVALVEQ
jgi:hypothetical protein